MEVQGQGKGTHDLEAYDTWESAEHWVVVHVIVGGCAFLQAMSLNNLVYPPNNLTSQRLKINMNDFLLQATQDSEFVRQ